MVASREGSQEGLHTDVDMDRGVHDAYPLHLDIPSVFQEAQRPTWRAGELQTVPVALVHVALRQRV